MNTGLRYSDTDLATDHDTFVEDHDTIHSYHDTNHDTKRVPLTNKQKDIVNFCSVPRTSREILDRAGVVYHYKKYSQHYITSLVAAGYLQMTNPDNPTASNQKYKKVKQKIRSVWIHYFYFSLHVLYSCSSTPSSRLIPVGWIIWQCGGFVLPVFSRFEVPLRQS